MKNSEKDLLTLAGLAVWLQDTGQNIKEYIDDYDEEWFTSYNDNHKLYKTNEYTEKAIRQLANQIYKRIKKSQCG